MSKAIFILCCLVIFFLILLLVGGSNYILRRAYLAMRADMGQQKRMLRLVSLGVGIWLLLTAVLAVGGYYSNFQYLPPRIFLFGILPPLIITIVLLCSKKFTDILRVIPPNWLIKAQSFRIYMELMLWIAFIGDLLPFQMTFQGFNMDIIVGITALFAGKVFFRKGRFFKPETVIWNVFGILLLINIVFITTVSTPADFRIFMNEPSSAIIATFPFIWIPTFIVPYALAMHLFSIKQVFIKNLQPFNE